MSDAATGTPGGEGREPTEEELRAYLGQMRAAPAGQIVAEVLSALLNGAQVKLGRKDARLLLDLSAGIVDQAREHLDDGLLGQVDEALTQLRLAQVKAEREVEERGEPEPGDLGTAPAEDATGDAASPAAGQPPPAQQPGESAASRLWVPGR